MALGEGRFSSAAHDKLAWEQSEIPSQIFLQPSGKMGNPTQPRTTTSNLASFYTANSEPTKMKTQKKNNKMQSLPASSPKLQRRILRHCNVPSPNSQFLPFSLPCASVNTSKSNSTKNKEPESSASKTFDSSKMFNSSATMTHPWSTPTASTSSSKCRKSTKEQRHNTHVISQCHPLPSPSSSCHRTLNQILPGSLPRHPNFCHLEVQSNQTHHLNTDKECVTGCSQGKQDDVSQISVL